GFVIPVLAFVVAGVAAVWWMAPSTPTTLEGDAGVPVAVDPPSIGDVRLPPEPGDAGSGEGMDGASPPVVTDAPHPTTHEREEAAKDALWRARRALAAGDVDAARDALREAEGFDPGNPDIAELRATLDP